MTKKMMVLSLVVLFSMGFFGLALAQGTPDRWNILMLGDSITEYGAKLVLGGYPEAYADKLEDEFGTDTVFEFIGRKGSADAPREGYAAQNSAFIKNILQEGNSNGLYQYLEENPPDVVLLHISTNDVWQYTPASTVENNIRDIIAELKSHNSDVIVCLAQIIPYRAIFPYVPIADWIVYLYNLRIAEIGADTANVVVVDQNSGYYSIYSTDGIHPNPFGQAKMANEWFEQCPCVYQYE